jgi:hypothetical protein
LKEKLSVVTIEAVLLRKPYQESEQAFYSSNIISESKELGDGE